jgi:hypothetical protein
MKRTARTPARPALVALPAPGDRVCLKGSFDYTDAHDHGTVVGLAYRPTGWHAEVEWDVVEDDFGPTGYARLDALDLRCSIRHEGTPHVLPATGVRS